MTDHGQLCNLLKNYYNNVFSITGQVDSLVEPTYSSEAAISNEQNDMLTAELEFEEFSEAVKCMHLDKASGPDGLNPDCTSGR